MHQKTLFFLLLIGLSFVVNSAYAISVINAQEQPALQLIKTSFVDNQGQLIQRGLIKGEIRLPGLQTKRIVWVNLKLTHDAYLPGQLVLTTNGLGLLEIPITPEQITLVEHQLLSSQSLVLLVVYGDYQEHASEFEAQFYWEKLLEFIKAHLPWTLNDLQNALPTLQQQGIIKFSKQPGRLAHNKELQRVAFFLRQQLLTLQVHQGNIKLVLKTSLPRLPEVSTVRFSGLGYIEYSTEIHIPLTNFSQANIVEPEIQATQRIQTMAFYTGINLNDWDIRLIALQSEMVENGHRQPGRIQLIRQSHKVYANTFTIHDFRQCHFHYWGKIFLTNGKIVDLPKTKIPHIRVPHHTERITDRLLTLFPDDAAWEWDDEDF